MKIPKLNCIAMVTGGVKTGKSMLSVWLAFRKNKSQRRNYWIKYFLCKIFHKTPPEKPYLYSNVKLAGVEYVPLTEDMLKRKTRLNYGSVAYIQETSLVADSMTYKALNEEENERIVLYNKLFGHETRGGYLVYDTQCIQDNHYGVKRCLNTYFWIHHNTKIPFFCLLRVRELKHSEDDGTVNSFNSDVEDDLKLIVIPKKVWKMYDAYCYSALTDDLPTETKTEFIPIPKGPFKRANLKVNKIVSFKKYKTIREYNEDE